MTKSKIGIFGGSFDPIHYGHLNSMQTVAERMGLDGVRLIPTFRSPLRPQTQGATPEQRLEMCKLAVAELSIDTVVDDQEIQRGGISYTVDTLRALTKANLDDHYFLIIGMDQFGKFDEWKDFSEIIELADIVATSRPAMEFPSSIERFPPGLRPFVEDFDGRQALLKGGHAIHFVKLQDIEASSTEIRKKIRLKQSIHHLVPLSVEDYIRERGLYASVSKDIGDFKKFTGFCAAQLKEKGGIRVRGFDLTTLDAPTDFTLVTSGTSTRHATALADSLVKEVKKEYGVWPQSIEGTGEGRWIVIDYGALIIHSFYDFVRHEYRLEELWKDGQELSL